MRALCSIRRAKGAEVGSAPAGFACGDPATVRIEYGCVHEHIGSTDACDRHAKRVLSTVTWCSGCWLGADPHKCLLVGRVAA
jgi:hypothetical protein